MDDGDIQQITGDTPDFNDSDPTLVSGTSSGDIPFSAQELRSRLGIQEDEKFTNYANLRPIGLGGVGAVYEGFESGANRNVAIKILRPQYRYRTDRIEGFVREARATAQIDHPNIVPVYRFGVFEDEGVYFTMKRVHGETLRAVLAKLAANEPGYSRRYTLRQLIEIFIASCNGVAFANKNGILHGDLKPANIMVGSYGEVLVMDWGMSRYRRELDDQQGRKISLGKHEELHDTPPPEELPQIGGTPAFMAPEHLSGAEKQLTERSEVYSLGTILYTILTRKNAPFDTTLSREKIIESVVRGRFPAPRRAAPANIVVPRELEAICLKAMHRKPEKRYAKVSELIDEIRNYLDGYPVRAYSPLPHYRLWKWLRRHPLIPGTLLAVAIGWVGFLFYNMAQDKAMEISLFQQAQYNAAQALDYSNVVRKLYRQFRSDRELDHFSRYRLFRQISQNLALMSNANATALAILSRLPMEENSRGFDSRMVLAQEMFRNNFTLFQELGDQMLLSENVRNFRKRWNNLFVLVLKNDPELRRLSDMVESGKGFLRVEIPKNWQAALQDAKGEKVSVSGLENSWVSPVLMDAGDYVIKFTHPEKGSFTFPVRVSPARPGRLQLTFPRRIPDGFCYVGDEELPLNDRILSDSGIDVPGFFISRREVSIGEYLEFWKSLSDRDKLKHLAVTSLFSAEPPSPMWDMNGNLRAPYTPELPITGITADSAQAYCRYLSKKKNMVIRLPSAREWEKASFRYAFSHEGLFADTPGAKDFPAGAPVGMTFGDYSVFGAGNMHGNVRELLQGGNNKVSLVSGGSFLTSCAVIHRGREQFTVSGEGDIGFRYVAEVR